MQSVIQYIEKELSGLYPKEEIKGFTRLIFEHVCGLNYTQVFVNRGNIISQTEKEKIEVIVGRLKTYEPIQYILGETEFYEIRLKVNRNVLIPRPETEELVQWILETNQLKSPIVLDIGTGSGCIALALKKELPEAVVSATDNSKEALNTARENAKTNHLDVDFFKSDILKWENESWEKYNIIVSNPPYVREVEKKQIHPNVLEYEPESALFVSDSDPLVFYRRIGEFSLKHLKNDGFLFFEINENMGDEIIIFFEKLGFKNIYLKNDISGKDRMLRCQI